MLFQIIPHTLRIVPERIEFWQEGKLRLHDRVVYVRGSMGWTYQRLYP